MAKSQVYFVPRDKNKDGLALLGLSIEAAEEIISELTGNDHLSGPEADTGGFPGEVCKFQIVYGYHEVYIKLRLWKQTPFCISFHPSAFPRRLGMRKKS
jgi:hypothetical protein